MVRFLLSLALVLSLPLFSPAASANLDNVMAINAGSFIEFTRAFSQKGKSIS